MAKELPTTEIADVPELVRLVEEVRRSRRPRVLKKAGEEIAMLVPLPDVLTRDGRRAGRRPPTPAEVARSQAGTLAAAGSWRDIDAEALKDYVRRRRAASSRSAVRL